MRCPICRDRDLSIATDLFAQQTFYFELVLTMGDKVERLAPRGDVKEADLEQEDDHEAGRDEGNRSRPACLDPAVKRPGRSGCRVGEQNADERWEQVEHARLVGRVASQSGRHRDDRQREHQSDVP